MANAEGCFLREPYLLGVIQQQSEGSIYCRKRHLHMSGSAGTSNSNSGGHLCCNLKFLLLLRAGVMLTMQYRMHASICDWASNELYDGNWPNVKCA
eukprot:5376568-Pleurochrysis_carterae.AAC.2